MQEILIINISDKLEINIFFIVDCCLSLILGIESHYFCTAEF